MSAALLAFAALLIVGNGFFVGAEFAVLAARRSRLEPLARRSARARTAIRATEQLPLMISGCQFGITLCSLGLGALGEPAVAHLLEGPLEAARVPDGLLHPVALAVSLTIVAVLHMLLGEMVPKNLALAGPERAAMLLAPPLLGFVRLLRPIIVTLTGVAALLLRALRVEPVSELDDASSREQVAALIGESRHEGLLGGPQHQLLAGALAFDQRTAATVMLPLAGLITVPPDVTPAQIEDLVAATGYSRFPVAEPHPAAPRTGEPSTGEALAASHAHSNPAGEHDVAGVHLSGYVHLADILIDPQGRDESHTEPAAEHGEEGPDGRDRPVAPEWIRPLVLVPADDPLVTALGRMQRARAHLGVITATDGTALGVVALEDVLEELVGEVRDATQRGRGASSPQAR